MRDTLEIINELREYFEDRADAEYFTERAGAVPNEEMQMLALLDELLVAISQKGRAAIPRDVAEAHGMYLIGWSWLKHNAPDQISDCGEPPQ